MASREEAHKLIAPWWHTLVIVAVYFAVSALSSPSQLATRVHVGRPTFYAISIAMGWLTVGFVWLGLRLRGLRLWSLVGQNAWNWKPLLRDLGIALAFLVIANVLLLVVAVLMHTRTNTIVRQMLPHTSLETAMFGAVAITAGVGEELVFRGYLLNQFRAMTSSTLSGVLMQGFVFGASHGYQGGKPMLLVGVYGIMFGALAWWRRSLRPGMFAHVMHDAITGIVAARFL